MSKIVFCPRCGERSYEKLQSHSHCFNCLFSETLLLSKKCREKRDFMTLKEAEALLKKADVIKFQEIKKSKKDEAAS